jgi:hypothetical protein
MLLASLILWEGMPNCRSGRNLLREPNRPPVQRNPGTSGMPGAVSARTLGVPAVRVDPLCCGEPQLIDRKMLIPNHTFGTGTVPGI